MEQNNFSAGSAGDSFAAQYPNADARSHLRRAVRRLKNGFVLPSGILKKRNSFAAQAALSGLTQTSSAQQAPLMREFKVHDGKYFVLLFFDNHLQIINQQGVKVFSKTFTGADLIRFDEGVRIAQYGDIAIIVSPKFYPLEITRQTDTSWTIKKLFLTASPQIGRLYNTLYATNDTGQVRLDLSGSLQVASAVQVNQLDAETNQYQTIAPVRGYVNSASAVSTLTLEGLQAALTVAAADFDFDGNAPATVSSSFDAVTGKQTITFTGTDARLLSEMLITISGHALFMIREGEVSSVIHLIFNSSVSNALKAAKSAQVQNKVNDFKAALITYESDWNTKIQAVIDAAATPGISTTDLTAAKAAMATRFTNIKALYDDFSFGADGAITSANTTHTTPATLATAIDNAVTAILTAATAAYATGTSARSTALANNSDYSKYSTILTYLDTVTDSDLFGDEFLAVFTGRKHAYSSPYQWYLYQVWLGDTAGSSASAMIFSDYLGYLRTDYDSNSDFYPYYSTRYFSSTLSGYGNSGTGNTGPPNNYTPADAASSVFYSRNRTISSLKSSYQTQRTAVITTFNTNVADYDTALDALFAVSSVIDDRAADVVTVVGEWAAAPSGNYHTGFVYEISNESPWSVDEGYPSAVALFNQSLVIAGTDKAPNRLWYSRAGNARDFAPPLTSEIAVDSPHIRDIPGHARILDMRLSYSGLVVATEDAIYVEPPTALDAITPSAPAALMAEEGVFNGRIASEGNRYFFLSDNGKELHDIRYSPDFGGQSARNISALSNPDIFKDDIGALKPSALSAGRPSSLQGNRAVFHARNGKVIPLFWHETGGYGWADEWAITGHNIESVVIAGNDLWAVSSPAADTVTAQNTLNSSREFTLWKQLGDDAADKFAAEAGETPALEVDFYCPSIPMSARVSGIQADLLQTTGAQFGTLLYANNAPAPRTTLHRVPDGNEPYNGIYHTRLMGWVRRGYIIPIMRQQTAADVQLRSVTISMEAGI